MTKPILRIDSPRNELIISRKVHVEYQKGYS